MDSNFFRINLPYGMARNQINEWMAFNREYLPLGFNQIYFKDRFDINSTSVFPIHTKYSGITEELLNRFADFEGAIQRDRLGGIYRVFFYDQRTDPGINADMWNRYMERLKMLSTFKVA